MAKKVFFVDDEIVIRENIRTCIDWKKEGFDYCGDASDGEVALPLIEEHRPDILITDIKMPFMNGLELSAIVRKRFPGTKIVLLSGHDEFEYARQALRIGVEEYCLKPFGSTDIIRLLHDVADKIDRENRQQSRMDRLSRSFAEKEQAAREQLVVKLCGGLIASAEAIESAELLGFPLIARHYAVVVTDVRPVAEGAQDRPDPIPAAESAIAAAFAARAECLTGKRSRTESVWVFKSDDGERLRSLRRLAEDALKPVEAAHGCAIAFGIGSVQDRLQGVHASFLEAEEDKHWRRMTEQHQAALLELSDAFDQGLLLERERFIELLTIGSPDHADARIRQLAVGLAAVDWNASLLGYYVLNDATLEAVRKARKLYRAAAPEESLEDLKQMIRAVKSWDEACDYLAKLARLFWKWRADAAGKYGELIAQVKTFVQARYGQEGLSLQDAADHVNVSASHLSKVFSQETGQTFIEFLMMTRIRKAMELMRSSNAKSYEIASAVGYSDPHYFSNLFKRVTGMTIRDFRKNGWPQQTPLGEGGALD